VLNFYYIAIQNLHQKNMRKIILLSIAILFSFTAFSQDQTNKGKDFWIPYPEHIDGTSSAMGLYITSDIASSGTVTVGATVIPFVVTANAISPIFIGPNGAGSAPNTGVYLGGFQDNVISNKGIHIVAANPVVVYAHIIRSARSGATLALPTNVWGKEYIMPSYANSGTTASFAQLNVFAEKSNTVLEITPSITSRNGVRVAGVPFQITLPTVGDVYQLQFPQNQDPSGTTVKSIASGSGGCNKIAVFSSTTWSGINCTGASGGDNFYQQLFPSGSWGKQFFTGPLKKVATTSSDNNIDIIRVYVKDPTTIVTKMDNGVTVTLTGLVPIKNYYEYTSFRPTFLQADKPIQVIQFITSQSCGSPQTNSDPEMIALSSVEQTINDITVFSAFAGLVPPGQSQVNNAFHYINVIMKTSTIGTFRINGALPTTTFTPIAGTNYSYLKQNINVAAPISRLKADSGFNAIAYGFGNVESYGYNAGTNVKDLNTKLEVNNPNTDPSETEPSACTGSPFKFKVYFADSTTSLTALRYDSIKWEVLNNASNFIPNNFPDMIRPISPSLYVEPDSTNLRNGKNVAWYSLPIFYTVTTPGVYRVRITLYRTSNEGCGNSQDFEFDLIVTDPPTANFTAPTPGCYLEPLVLTETTPQFPKATYKWYWEVTELAPGPVITSIYTTRNVPSHIFTRPGIKRIRHSSITTPGCISDTISQTITVSDIPTATLSGSTTVCINAPNPTLTVNFFDGRAPWRVRYSINGTIQPDVVTSSNPYIINANTTVANTFIYRLEQVQNDGSTFCVSTPINQIHTVIVQPNATVTLRAGDDANPTVCINNAIPSIRYDLGGTFTNATVSGLPAGVTYTFAGGIITIFGTPTVFGTFPYVILPVGPCLVPVPPVGGTITVDNDATIALTSAVGTDNQTKCINTLITNIDYLVAGGGTGATIAWVPSVPTGIVFTPLGGNNFRISGTPSVSGTFNYTISTTGPCIKPTVTGSLIVTPDATVTLTTANNNQTVCVNNVIATIRYTIGGSGNGGSVSGLPAGVTGTYAGGIITISGTPTVSGVFNFIINPTGPCAFPIPALGGTLTVTGDATIALTTAIGTDNQIRCRNVAIANIEYFVGGTGTGATIAWVPSVPTGIVFTPLGGNNFRISGTPTVSGTFNYTISTTGPCVKPTANGTIVVNQLPVASYTFTTPSCANNTINFTNTTNPNAAGVSTWAWNFGDPASGAANTSALFNPSHTFALPGGYTVTLNAVNSNGCISDPNAIQNVLVNDTPRAGFIIPEVCLSDTYAQFLDTSRIATGAIISWQWYFDDPNATVANPNVSTLQNPTHSYTAVGIYDSVQLIVTSALGCRDTILQSLTVNGSFPVANFTVNNPATLCANDSVAIVEASTVFPGVITKIEIYWDNTNFPGVFQIDNNPFSGKIYRHLYPNFQAPLTKIFTIRYRAYSGGVCVNDKLTNITVNAAPLVQFNAMPNSCLLIPPFQITQVSEIGGVPGIGVYSGPGVSSTGLFTPGIAGIGTHTILYTFTSTAGGCVDTMSNRITVLDTAHATFSYVTPTCQGVPVSFTDLSTAPSGVVLANTVWDFGDGSGLQNFAPGSTFTHAFPGVGNYTVRMYNVSAAGCLSRDTSAVITIKPNHTITLTGANNVQTVCINAPLNPIIYTLGGGANNATVSGLPAGVTASVTGTTLTIQGSPTTTVASPFNFTITTTGNDCIIATASGIITVQPDHTIVLATGNINQSVCVNTPIDDITYTIGGGAAGFTVTGLPPGVTSAITGNTITISGTPTTTAGGPIFNFSITTTGNTCLTANAIGSIKVNPYPVPTFTPDKPVYCIPVATVKFNNGSTMPDGTGMTYVWDFDDVASGTLNTSTVLSPTHFFAIQRTYDVRLTATSLAVLNGGAIGCKRDVVIPLTTIKAQPKAAFTTNKPSVCIADDVIFTDLSDPTVGATTVSRFWDFDGDGTFEPANPNPTVTYTYPMAGTFAPTLYIVNSFGCHSDTLPKVFTVFPYPTVDAGINKTILEFGSVTLNPTVTGDVTDYLWTPNIYFNNNNRVKQPTASNIKDDVTYKLTVTSRSGCTVSDDVSIKVLRFPKIPNTFTPNNDGINDKWVIEYLNSYPNCRVQVFSRTGQLVFESKGYGTPWNGTLKGKQLPVDTYYYIIEPQANRDPITGYVTIVK